MNREVARAAVQQVVVKSPCSVKWETMEGDEKVRFCGECKLHVHNLSAVSEQEAAAIVTRLEGRGCVYFRKTANGTIVTDNCPVLLRAARKRLFLTAVLTLMTITYGLALAAQAEGVAVPGLVVDPRYGQSTEVGQLADFGYDIARDISRIVTLLSFFVCCFIPMDKRITVKRALIELIALACIPVLVYLIGTFFLNNFGGLGGGI